MTKEMGLPITNSIFMAGDFVAEMLEYYAEHAEEFLAPEPVDLDPARGSGEMIYQPLGIIFAVEPWNATVYQAVRPACGNLMAGNVVVLKHAGIVPQSAEAIEQIFTGAGLLKGVFTKVRANYDQVERIIEDRRVRGVTMMGSDAAGSIVASQAGKAIEPSVLELGGNDAQIVFEDADLDNIIACSMFRFMVAGQVCVSPKRMFIHEDIYDEFLDKFKERINATKIGDPTDPRHRHWPTFLAGCSEASEGADRTRR
ncbi:aldehyde dehydrogenase family protein [Flaviflexus ciconiae]|uniref:Aldehyde dehydrogenase family protein n=1 Tax=Flaviflexus ciconiae TaxID=2496867 RepID=A0A3S9PZW3_9ACTO|nr:aldehyde dehydrogenase family protein [Flaviflexus ciconiae]